VDKIAHVATGTEPTIYTLGLSFSFSVAAGNAKKIGEYAITFALEGEVVQRHGYGASACMCEQWIVGHWGTVA